jgi:hypothetical protein
MSSSLFDQIRTQFGIDAPDELLRSVIEGSVSNWQKTATQSRWFREQPEHEIGLLTMGGSTVSGIIKGSVVRLGRMPDEYHARRLIEEVKIEQTIAGEVQPHYRWSKG